MTRRRPLATTGSEAFEVFAAPVAALHRLTDPVLGTAEDREH
ncbi:MULTISPECIES: hypothetical protein [Kitasatospora]|nr:MULTISPECIES: hypothetical protein [Kitasatospora]